MSVDSTHPLYDEYLEEWEQSRDTYRGERIVKERGQKYLPPTSGQVEDGATVSNRSDGGKAYDAYRLRARYPDIVREAVDGMVGVMHQKPPTIELPESMEPIREKATLRNESLEMLLRRINEEQLVVGRVGMLADVIDVGEREGLPYISVYKAEHIINWDEGQRSRSPDPGQDDSGIGGIEPQNLNFVSLDETGPERVRDFEWEDQTKYRVLVLGDPIANEPQGEGVYRFGVFRENNTTFSEEQLETPNIRGNELNEIPFVFANTKDVVPDPDEPPLLGLSNLSLAIYRGEADYRQNLFAQSQDTFVTKGLPEGEKIRLGVGGHVNLPANGDAMFVGVSADGLSEQRSSLENDYRRAGEKAGQMFEPTSRQAESGDALRIRVTARTATLTQVALTGAFALEQILKIMARWMGADESQIVVTPNLDFVDDSLSGKELVDRMTAKKLGSPDSLESIHKTMQDKGMTEKTFEEELEAIERESELEFMQPAASTNPDGPEEDPVDPDSVDDDPEE